jgi:hypothetical protein
MVLVTTVTLLLTACEYRFWEPRAPERSFTPEDLLIDQDIVPHDWKLTFPLFPTGDDLCTSECATIGFKATDDASSIEYGGHSVYRYLSTGIARRTFKVVYLSATKLQASVSGWTYQSPVAEQSHFGCGNMAGNVGVYCEWGGQYEEYIVVFGARVPPGEVSMANIKQIEESVRAIDARMAQYLEKPSEDSND